MQPPSTPTRPGCSSKTGVTSMATRQSGSANNTHLQQTPSRTQNSNYYNESGDPDHSLNSMLVTPQTVTKFKPTSAVLQNLSNTRTPEQNNNNQSGSSSGSAYSPEYETMDNSGSIFMDASIHTKGFNRGSLESEKPGLSYGQQQNQLHGITKRQHIGTLTPGHEEDARDLLMSKLLLRSPEYTPKTKPLRGLSLLQSHKSNENLKKSPVQGIKRKLAFEHIPNMHENDLLLEKLSRETSDIFESDDEKEETVGKDDLKPVFADDQKQISKNLFQPMAVLEDEPLGFASPSTPSSKVISFEQAERWHNMSRLNSQGELRELSNDKEEQEVFITKKQLKNPFLSDKKKSTHRASLHSDKLEEVYSDSDSDSEVETEKLQTFIYKKK
ncbi:hypothetical protein ACO0RG_003323 [Hanseniaspora osmophila]